MSGVMSAMRVRAARLERARDRVRLIAQIVGGLQHALPQLVGHDARAVEDMGDRARGDARSLSDVPCGDQGDRLPQRRNACAIVAIVAPSRSVNDPRHPGRSPPGARVRPHGSGPVPVDPSRSLVPAGYCAERVPQTRPDADDGDDTVRGVLLPGGSRVELRRGARSGARASARRSIRIKASSICGSDVRAIYREHLGKGAEGYIAGHHRRPRALRPGGIRGPRRDQRQAGRPGRDLPHRRLRPLPRLPRRLHDRAAPRPSAARTAGSATAATRT